MDWLTFVAHVVDALAWPLTILIIIAILRKPLSGLLPLLQRLKYKDFELEFGRHVEEVRQEVQSELPAPPGPSLIQPDEEVIERLAGVSPRSAVLEAWRRIEEALFRVAQRRQINVQARSPLAIFRALQRAEVLDPGKLRILHELRVLRNDAAHAPDFALSKDSVLEYSRLASTMADYLSTL